MAFQWLKKRHERKFLKKQLKEFMSNPKFAEMFTLWNGNHLYVRESKKDGFAFQRINDFQKPENDNRDYINFIYPHECVYEFDGKDKVVVKNAYVDILGEPQETVELFEYGNAVLNMKEQTLQIERMFHSDDKMVRDSGAHSDYYINRDFKSRVGLRVFGGINTIAQYVERCQDEEYRYYVQKAIAIEVAKSGKSVLEIWVDVWSCDTFKKEKTVVMGYLAADEAKAKLTTNTDDIVKKFTDDVLKTKAELCGSQG